MVWRRLRQTSQLLVFVLFVFLFLQTEYKDNDVLPYAVNLFLRLDPLVAHSTVLADRTLITLVWPSLLVVILTLTVGRFFCGWFCPLGSLLDAVSLIVRRPAQTFGFLPRLKSLKFLLLIALLGSSIFTLQLVYLFDPISLLIRSLALAVYPSINIALHALFGGLYETGSDVVTAISEPSYRFFKDHFLAFEQPYFQSALPVGLIFLAILALEAVERYAPRMACAD